MNIFKKAAVSLAATSMLVAPVAASAAQSAQAVRAASVQGDESELAGGSTWIILGVLAVAIVVAVVVASDDDDPKSP